MLSNITNALSCMSGFFLQITWYFLRYFRRLRCPFLKEPKNMPAIHIVTSSIHSTRPMQKWNVGGIFSIGPVMGMNLLKEGWMNIGAQLCEWTFWRKVKGTSSLHQWEWTLRKRGDGIAFMGPVKGVNHLKEGWRDLIHRPSDGNETSEGRLAGSESEVSSGCRTSCVPAGAKDKLQWPAWKTPTQPLHANPKIVSFSDVGRVVT